MMDSLESTILRRAIIGDCVWSHPEVQAFFQGFLLECPNQWNTRAVSDACDLECTDLTSFLVDTFLPWRH